MERDNMENHFMIGPKTEHTGDESVMGSGSTLRRHYDQDSSVHIE